MASSAPGFPSRASPPAKAPGSPACQPSARAMLLTIPAHSVKTTAMAGCTHRGFRCDNRVAARSSLVTPASISARLLQYSLPPTDCGQRALTSAQRLRTSTSKNACYRSTCRLQMRQKRVLVSTRAAVQTPSTVTILRRALRSDAVVCRSRWCTRRIMLASRCHW
jgi:hypothetical protein